MSTLGNVSSSKFCDQTAVHFNGAEPRQQFDERNARMGLSAALEMDPYGEPEGSAATDGRKAQAVRAAAMRMSQVCLDERQRSALAALLREARRLTDEGTLPSQDVVWLIDTALGVCSRGFAWVKDSGLDLADDLLCEMETQRA